MTGSDTSSNAFFSKLHVTAAQQIGVDLVVLVAANSSGGVCGKMISPQSIAVATSATNLVGKEGDIFRFSLKHSLLLTTVVGIMVTLQAYVFKWMIPAWEAVTEHAPAALHTAGEGPAEAVTKAVHSAAPMFSGSNYLVATFVIALVVTVLSMKTGKLIELTGGDDEMPVH